MIFLTIFFSTMFILLILSFIVALTKEGSRLRKIMKTLGLTAISVLVAYSFLLVDSVFIYLSAEKTEQLVQSRNVAYIKEEQSHCLATISHSSKTDVEILFKGDEELTKLHNVDIIEGEDGENVLYTYKRELKNPFLRNTFGLLIGKDERQELHVSDIKLKVK